jgi:hypothetical protein
MPLRVSQMAEGTGVDPSVLSSALEDIAVDALILKALIERDVTFYPLPGALSRLELGLGVVKSGFSVMVLTCLNSGVDFIAQDTREVPSTDDRSTGEDPAADGGLPPWEVDGGSAMHGPGEGEVPDGDASLVDVQGVQPDLRG